MNIARGRRDNRIKQAQTLLDQLDALVILSRSFDSQRRLESSQIRSRLELSSNAALEALIPQLEERLTVCRRALKPTHPSAYYAEIVREQSIDRDQILFVPKWILLGL